MASDQKPTAQVDTAERLRLLAAPSRDSDWVRVRAIDLRSAADELDQARRTIARVEAVAARGRAEKVFIGFMELERALRADPVEPVEPVEPKGAARDAL